LLYKASFKLEADGREGSARHLYLTKDTACYKECQVDYLNVAPIVRAVIEGRPCTILLDTGSSISLIQPGVSVSGMSRASATPFGMTGDELSVRGEQLVTFTINGETYSHEFCVCDLSTDAEAIIETDFLSKMNANLDLKAGRL
jgi:hypothetical protein